MTNVNFDIYELRGSDLFGVTLYHSQCQKVLYECVAKDVTQVLKFIHEHEKSCNGKTGS